MSFDLPPPPVAPVAIYEDGGGLVHKYRVMAYQYRMEGRQVRILGSCRSACVLYLGVPNVCVGPKAEIKAHHAYDLKTLQLRPEITKKMMSEIPQNIAARLLPNIQREYTEGATLRYKELLKLGIKDCSTMPQISQAEKHSDPVRVKSIPVYDHNRKIENFLFYKMFK